MPVEAVLLIEICNTNKIKDDTKKLSELMENMLSVKEAFVIDKNSLDITKICRTKTNKPTAPKKDSKIELLKVNLSKTLKILNNSFITSRS